MGVSTSVWKQSSNLCLIKSTIWQNQLIFQILNYSKVTVGSTKDRWLSTLRSPGINHVRVSTFAGTYFQGPAKCLQRQYYIIAYLPPVEAGTAPAHAGEGYGDVRPNMRSLCVLYDTR